MRLDPDRVSDGLSVTVGALVAILAWTLMGQPAFGQTGSATLTWAAPTKNTDGSNLTNLSGFKVYWGTVQGTYPNSATLSNPGLTSYVVPNLTPATWYFTTTALSASGAESLRSNVASKLIAGAAPNPPTIPQPVTVAGPVFTLQVTDDSLVLPQVGTVVAGKPCDPAQQVAFGGKTYMLVPKANVTPLPGLQLVAAWSDGCH